MAEAKIEGGVRSEHYDLLVIGGGSGGVAAARRARTYGARVALVEKARMGGTCVNVGCVPKKVMWNAATVRDVIRDAPKYGYAVTGEATIDWAHLKRIRDAYVKRLNDIYERNLASAGVDTIFGTARFVGPKEVQVGDVTYTADHILIAVGGEPIRLDIPGVEHSITSDGFFEMEEMPQKVAVVGAGYIGVELAGVLNSMGAETHVIIRDCNVLRSFDSMISEELLVQFRQRGIQLHPYSNLKALHKDESTGKRTVELESGERLEGFDQVLVAIGRKPVTHLLHLDIPGVKTDERGSIHVDEFQNTNVEGIYAVGDCLATGYELTPVAIAQGRRLADRLFGGMENACVSQELVATVVFAHPPIGAIGLTEAAARKKFGDDQVTIFNSKFTGLFYGPLEMEADDKPKVAMKLVCVGEEQKIVGLHCIGEGSDEMLQGFAVAVTMGATKADFDRTIAIHPTAAEEFVTMAPWGLSGIISRK